MRTDGRAAQYLKPGLCCGQLFIVVPFAPPPLLNLRWPLLFRLGASDRTNKGFALEMCIVLRNGSVFALQSARAFLLVFFFIASGNRDSPLRGFLVNKTPTEVTRSLVLKRRSIM